MCTKWHPDESDRLHCIITSREARLGMFLASLLRRIAFSYYDYKAYNFNIEKTDFVLMNPLMILVKIIKLRWIHILSYDQMVSRKINNQTTRCANSIFYTTLFTNSAPNYT
ncbi:hypothetical protein B1200_21750 [Escherichia coli]|nr:hypothetical protein B1200_21750 [Escherichia coli]